MDLNQLFFQHQISLMRANAAASRCEREGHRADAQRIARRIGNFQLGIGCTAPSLLQGAFTR